MAVHMNALTRAQNVGLTLAKVGCVCVAHPGHVGKRRASYLVTGTAQIPSRHCTGGELQQSPACMHAPPRPTHASWLGSTHIEFSQNPEQHSKPLVQGVPTGGPLVAASAAAAPASGAAAVLAVGMHPASVQKPRMLGVSSCPSR